MFFHHWEYMDGAVENIFSKYQFQKSIQVQNVDFG